MRGGGLNPPRFGKIDQIRGGQGTPVRIDLPYADDVAIDIPIDSRHTDAVAGRVVPDLGMGSQDNSETSNINGFSDSNGRVNHATESGAAVSLEQNCGPRPPISRLLQCLDQANRPALFACGPPELVKELERSVGKRRQRVAIYKETFEM